MSCKLIRYIYKLRIQYSRKCFNGAKIAFRLTIILLSPLPFFFTSMSLTFLFLLFCFFSLLLKRQIQPEFRICLFEICSSFQMSFLFLLSSVIDACGGVSFFLTTLKKVTIDLIIFRAPFDYGVLSSESMSKLIRLIIFYNATHYV